MEKEKPDASLGFHTCLSVLVTWQLAYPRVSDLREESLGATYVLTWEVTHITCAT